MVRANDAEVVWDAQKKDWIVRIRAGEEVVRRPCKGARDLPDEDEAVTAALAEYGRVLHRRRPDP